MNRFELFLAMVEGRKVTLKGAFAGFFYTGYIQSIQLEDGSGFKFNVTIRLENNTTETVFVNTKNN